MPDEPSTNEEQISEEGGEIEDSSEEEITTVTDSAEDQDEADIPAEDDAAPVEDPVDNDNEAENPDSSDLGMQIMEAGTVTEHTITYKIMKADTEGEKEASSAATVEFAPDTVGKDGNTVKVKEEIAIKFTVTPAEEIKLDDTTPVTAKVGDTAIASKEITREGDTNTFTIANGTGDDALADNVEITIHVADVTYQVSAPAKDEAKGITWKIKKSTETAYADPAVTSVDVKKSESVTVQATLEKGKDSVAVTLNGETKTLEKKAADATGDDSAVEFTITAASLISTDGTTVAVAALAPTYVVKSTVVYGLTAPAETTGVTVTIKDAKNNPVAAATTGDNAGNYELINDDTYTIEIKRGDAAIALKELASVKANGEALKYNKGFSFKADDTVDEADREIEVTLKAAEAHTITVVMDGNDADAATKIKAEAFKTTGNADADAAKLVETTIASNTTYDVWEGTDFSFTLAATNTPYYKIDKVELIKNGETTVLTADNGKYTIAKVDDAATVKVYTILDETQAYSITFTDANGNVKGVKADLKGATSYTKVDANKAIKFMPGEGTTKSVKFTVDALDGYSVEKVASGTTDVQVAEEDSEKVYTYTFAENTKAATITINTKAADLTADKYVEFVVDESVTLAVTDSKIKPVQKDGKDTNVYKLTAPVVASEGVEAVEGISELPFTLTVPYGFTLASDSQTFADGTKVRQTVERAKSDDGSTWTYTYKAVAKLLADDGDATLGTEDNPYPIIVAAAGEEMVSLTYADSSEGTVAYKTIPDWEENGFQNLSGGELVDPGTTVILQVAEGQTLNVDGEDVTLDASNKYSFVAKLDDTKDNESAHVIDVQNAATGDYTLQYAVNPKDTTNISYDTVGKDAVDVAYGSKVYLSLTKNEGGAAAEISKYETSLETPKSKVKTEAGGKAVVDVADADITVTLYTVKPETVGSITVVNEVEAAKITLTCKDASGKTLTAKGIKNNGTVKLDATSTTSYALTLKEGKKTLNAAEYGEALKVATDPAGVVNATIVNGSLQVDTLKAEKATVTISAMNDSELLKFTVDGQKPALKVKSVTSNNQGMHDILLDVAADASIKPISSAFDLYYEVNVAKKAGDNTGASTMNKEGIYYLAATDENGKTAPVSQLFTVNDETDKTKFANTYTFTVKLVAVDHGTTVPVSNPKTGTPVTAALSEQLVKFDSTASVAKDFKTRAEYYEDKLGVTKKTTKFYSGQYDVLVAIPKFSKNASHIEEVEAVVYNKDGSQADYGVSAYVDPETLGVYVDATYDSAGTYDVVIYATATKVSADEGAEYNMYQASAKVPITVQKGINDITVDSPGQVALLTDKKGNKKDASITLKATGWYENDWEYGSSIKAQTQKFTYELATTGESEDDNYYGTPYLGNSKNADKVVVKNNKITVKKDFIVGADPDDNYFTVLVTANDYSDNDVYEEVRITVTDKALEIGSVQLMKYDDNDVPTPCGATISTTDLDYAYVKITDTNGQPISPSLVTLTPNKGKVYVSSYGYIRVDGYQKNLTIKAVTKDGGKKSKSSIKYTIKYPEGLTYSISTPEVDNDAKINQTGDRSWTYKGTGNNNISFSVIATVGDQFDYDATTAKYNYTVKVTGGKITSSKADQADGDYSITPTKDEVKVTITDKTKKAPNTTEFTIKDTNWQTAAAPKVSTKNKLYYAMDAEDGYTIGQSLTYTVTAKNASYNAVKLTYLSGPTIDGVSGTKNIINNNLALSVTPKGVGTAKYSAVYGDKEGSVFYPKTKAATLSIKVNKVSNPKAVAKYTINPSVSMSVPLQAKPVPVEGMVKFNKVLSANVKGEKNQFYDYFAVSADGKSLEIRTDKRDEAGLKALAELGKEHLTGYLVYQYSNQYGETITKQDKITVTINSKAIPKYTATNVNIVTEASVTAKTKVELAKAPVSLAQVTSGTEGWNASLTTGDGTGVVTLTAANPAAGTSKVDLYVIPTGSSNAAETNADKIKEVGVKVQVSVTVKAADDTKSKITIAKGTKTPVASINGAKVDLTVTLAEGSDFTCNLSNATIATNGAAKTDAGQITDAAKKKAAEAVNSVNYTDGAITIVLDRDKLDGNKQYNIPVDLTFTAGAKETVYFSVKTEKIPSMDDVKKIVSDELKDFAVSSANYNDATEAAKEVEDAAKAIKIPALSGIQVSAAAAVDAAKFGDTGSGETAVKGDHKIKITLTDVTKNESNTADVEITVTEKQTVKTLSLGDALKEALEKYAIPDDEGKVAEGKTKVTPDLSRWAVQKDLQDAADSVEKGKYNVSVSGDFKVNTETVADNTPASKAVKVISMTFTYTVKDAMTDEDVEDEGTSYDVKVAGTDSKLGVPTVTEPTKPDKGTVTLSKISGAPTITISTDNAVEESYSVTVTITGDDNADNTVTWSIKNDSTATGVTVDATGKVTVATNATAGTVTLVATSKYDTSVSEELEITIEEAE